MSSDEESTPIFTNSNNILNVEVPLQVPEMILKFHPGEVYFPKLTDGRVECTYCLDKFTYRGVEYTRVEYKFDTYEANGAIGFCWWFFPKSECLGYHLHDDERLSILLDSNGKIEWVSFQSHSRGQYIWKRFEDCDRTPNNTLIVYVARAGHGFYPEDGMWVRAGCCANDLCSDDGVSYPISIIGKHDSPRTPPQASVTLWERFWLCCYADTLRHRP